VVLITIGVIFLLGNLGIVNWHHIGLMFARYWPLLLILWGLVKLLEYVHARREGYQASGIGFGGVVFLLFIIMCGMIATQAARVNWKAVGSHIDIDNDFEGIFFGTPYNFTEELEHPFPAGSSLRIISDRGDVMVLPWDQEKIKVVVRKRILATSEDQANEVHNATHPTVTATDKIITLNANTSSGGGGARVNTDLEIYLPKQAAVDVATARGKVIVRDRIGDVRLRTTRKDAELMNIQGNVEANLRGGSIRAENVSGNVSVEENVDEASLSKIGGAVRLSGSFDSIRLSAIAKGVSFQSSRTDMQLARLDGDLIMASGELRAKSLTGPFRIATRSKDIHIEDISGEVRVQDRNAEIDIRAGKLPLSNIEIDNDNGRIQLILPPDASFQLDARTLRGDIESDFPQVKIEEGQRESRATGAVGSGGAQVRLKTEHGDIEIRKAG
jgi:DUF4097 and DUF4098 domain-containing protein YvlB